MPLHWRSNTGIYIYVYISFALIMTGPLLQLSQLINHDAVAIGVGAVAGALARYHCGRMATEWIASSSSSTTKAADALLGWHTALINIGGSFILGGVAATPLAAGSSGRKINSSNSHGINNSFRPPGVIQRSASIRSQPQQQPTKIVFPSLLGTTMTPRSKLLLGVGFCGSFTTFSTYSVDVVTWLSQGQTTKALSYIAVNNVGGICAAATGMMLVKKLMDP